MGPLFALPDRSLPPLLRTALTQVGAGNPSDADGAEVDLSPLWRRTRLHEPRRANDGNRVQPTHEILARVAPGTWFGEVEAQTLRRQCAGVVTARHRLLAAPCPSRSHPCCADEIASVGSSLHPAEDPLVRPPHRPVFSYGGVDYPPKMRAADIIGATAVSACSHGCFRLERNRR